MKLANIEAAKQIYERLDGWKLANEVISSYLQDHPGNTKEHSVVAVRSIRNVTDYKQSPRSIVSRGSPTPVIATKVGRNDPCTCGSERNTIGVIALELIGGQYGIASRYRESFD